MLSWGQVLDINYFPLNLTAGGLCPCLAGAILRIGIRINLMMSWALNPNLAASGDTVTSGEGKSCSFRCETRALLDAVTPLIGSHNLHIIAGLRWQM